MNTQTRPRAEDGSGCLTLIRMLPGRTTPSLSARLGTLADEPRLLRYLTAREKFWLVAAARGLAVHRIDAMLAELPASASDRVARCLPADPDLLVLDELTSVLDPAGVHDLRQAVRGPRRGGTDRRSGELSPRGRQPALRRRGVGAGYPRRSSFGHCRGGRAGRRARHALSARRGGVGRAQPRAGGAFHGDHGTNRVSREAKAPKPADVEPDPDDRSDDPHVRRARPARGQPDAGGLDIAMGRLLSGDRSAHG